MDGPTGAVSAMPAAGFGQGPVLEPVAPGATIPSGPMSRERSASVSASEAFVSSQEQYQQQYQQQDNNRATGGFISYNNTKDNRQEHPVQQHARHNRHSVTKTRSSPHMVDDMARSPGLARMASEERDHRSVRALAEFFRSQSPPRSNLMSRPDESEYSSSTGSPPSSRDGTPFRTGHMSFSTKTHHIFPLLIHPGRWGRLKSIKGKKKRRRSSGGAGTGNQRPQIQLPDSAVAGRTTGGHRHIAISIPIEHCHLGPQTRSQYPVYVPADSHRHGSIDRQATKAAAKGTPRTATNERGTVTVLKPVAEDRESISSSATRSQIRRFGSLDGTEATPLRPPPQQQESDIYRPMTAGGERGGGGNGGGPGTAELNNRARVRSMPMLNKDMDFSSQDELPLDQSDVWVSTATASAGAKRDPNQSDRLNLASRVYIPRSGGDQQSKDTQDGYVPVYVPTRNSSVKRSAGPVADALAVLTGTGAQAQHQTAQQQQDMSSSSTSRVNSGNNFSFGSGGNQAGRMSMQSIAASIASKLSESEAGMITVATARVARARPGTILLDTPNMNFSPATPLVLTPLLVDFPSPPGTQDMFVNLDPPMSTMSEPEHEQDGTPAMATTSAVRRMKHQPPMSLGQGPEAVFPVGATNTDHFTSSGGSSAGEYRDDLDFSPQQDRKTKVRERKQRDMQILLAQSRSDTSGSEGGMSLPNTPMARFPPPSPPLEEEESPVLRQTCDFNQDQDHDADVSSMVALTPETPQSRRSRSMLSLTPLIVIADVTPVSPPKKSPTLPTTISSTSSSSILPTSDPTPSPETRPQFLPRSGGGGGGGGGLGGVIRPSTSLPLDRASLARRLEWREVREWREFQQQQQQQQQQQRRHQHQKGGQYLKNKNKNKTYTNPNTKEGGEGESNNKIRAKTSSSSLFSLAAGGAFRQHRRNGGGLGGFLGASGMAVDDSHDSLVMLSRSELVSRYENLRDKHVKDTERRLRRLEKSGDVWLKSIAPMLENLNRTLSSGLDVGRRRGKGKGVEVAEDEDDRGSVVGVNDLAGGVRKSVREWRQRRRDIDYMRRGASQGHGDEDDDDYYNDDDDDDDAKSVIRAKTSHGLVGAADSLHTQHYHYQHRHEQHHLHHTGQFDEQQHDDAVRIPRAITAATGPSRPGSAKGRVVSAAVEAIESRKPTSSASSIHTRAVMAGEQRRYEDEDENEHEDEEKDETAAVMVMKEEEGHEHKPEANADRDGDASTSGMETLEPLMRELQGAARLSLESLESLGSLDSNGEMNTPLVEESAVFGDF